MLLLIILLKITICSLPKTICNLQGLMRKPRKIKERNNAYPCIFYTNYWLWLNRMGNTPILFLYVIRGKRVGKIKGIKRHTERKSSKPHKLVTFRDCTK